MAFDISKFAGTAPVPVSDSDGMVEIPVENIVDNPKNFYPRPDGAAMTALMESIEANGLLEPPTVVPDEGGCYRLISGHSRMAAIRRLRNEDGASAKPTHRWDTVLCRVLEPMSKDAELTAVIEANRQRVKSPSLLADEAERLTAAYVRRQEAGESFPGGIRQAVAQALQVNATKISNARTIKAGLKVPGIMDRWERDDLPEAAALVIARMDIDTQYRLLDWMISRGGPWSIQSVKLFDRIWAFCKHKCPETAGLCPNAERMVADKLKGGCWHCGGCCKTCLSRRTCQTVCDFCKPDPASEPEVELLQDEDPRCRLDSEAPRWIPAEERLPEPEVWVLCIVWNGDLEVLRYAPDAEEWRGQNLKTSYFTEGVTYWTPIPDFPEKGE